MPIAEPVTDVPAGCNHIMKVTEAQAIQKGALVQNQHRRVVVDDLTVYRLGQPTILWILGSEQLVLRFLCHPIQAFYSSKPSFPSY